VFVEQVRVRGKERERGGEKTSNARAAVHKIYDTGHNFSC
jgi:hypothetical protein